MRHYYVDPVLKRTAVVLLGLIILATLIAGSAGR